MCGGAGRTSCAAGPQRALSPQSPRASSLRAALTHSQSPSARLHQALGSAWESAVSGRGRLPKGLGLAGMGSSRPLL